MTAPAAWHRIPAALTMPPPESGRHRRLECVPVAFWPVARERLRWVR